MHLIISQFKKYKQLLKAIFVFAVFSIVTWELLSIIKNISIVQLTQLIHDLPFWKILLMITIGLIAVFPMIGYDFALDKLLQTKFSRKKIIEGSWTINTINNLAGFGGLVSVGMRAAFYQQRKNKEMLSALTKVLLFTLSGLSVFSLLTLVAFYFAPTSIYLKQYWIWLLAGAAYFPIIYWLTGRKIIGDLTSAFRLSLLGTSFLEWSGVILSFLSIGILLNLNFSLFDVFILFIAAMVVGIASMIPGSIGSFDVIMILGLVSLGVDRENAVLWLLIYRLVYYLIPAIIGIVLFSKNSFRQFNERYSNIPSQLSLEIFHKIEVGLIYFSGIMMVLIATVPETFAAYSWLQHLNPFHFRFVTQFPSVVLGLALLVMGRGIASRVIRAYYPTIGLLLISIAYSFTLDVSLFTVFYLSLICVLVIISKPELTRTQLVYSWEHRTIDGAIWIALMFLYLAIGVYQLPPLPQHIQLHHFMEFYLLPSEQIWLTGLLGTALIAIVMTLLIRYLEGHKIKPGEDVSIPKLETILTTYGGNSDSELVFLNDKRVFLYPQENPTVFLQFSLFNNKCIVMGEPSGNKKDFSAAIEAFIQETDRLSYLPVFYEVQQETVMTLHEFGYDFIKMGESALVNLNDFSLSGKRLRGTRSTMNRIKKAGYEFSVIYPPFNKDTMVELKQISDQWLHGRKERGFSLGFFDENYLQRNPIAIVKNEAGEIVSFANIIPSYSNEIGTIDLMRHNPSTAPSGSMDYLFIHLFDYFKEQGIQFFDLGMAPLSKVGQSRKSFIQERIASLVYNFGNRFYSFQGLRDYKEKYASKWVPRYTLYSRDSWIVYVILALLIVDNRTISKN